MLVITVEVDAPSGKAIGIKEELAQHLEQFGDSRIVKIDEVKTAPPKQMTMRDFRRT